MSKYCPNCGAEIAEGAAFCPNCGKSLSPEGDARETGTPQEVSSGEAPVTQTVAPAGTRQSVSTPPQAPQQTGKSRKGLLLGGCAVAGVLGVVGVALVGALLFFFVLASEPAPEPQPEPEPAPQPAPEPAPDEGSLESIVQEQVGDFALQEVQEDPAALDAGATQALIMLYAAPDGTEVIHNLAAFPSPEDAERILQGMVDYLVQEKGFEKVEEIPLENDQGERFGTAVLLQGETEIVVWTNAQLFAGAEGPPEAAVEFFSKTPY